MVIYLGADHRGAELKDRIAAFVKGLGYEIADVHPAPTPDDDYPDIAGALASALLRDPVNSRGVLFCGSGAGMDIAANKFNGVRSVLGLASDQVFDARHDDDVNVLTLSADFVPPESAEQMVKIFISAPFAPEEKYMRRLAKIKAIESNG